MKKLIIIKLGGSVVTNKDSDMPKARVEVIENLSREIKQIVATDKYQLILVHGAGSFAHPIVKKSGIHKGMYSEEQKLAFSQAQINMLLLNNLILQSLINNQLPCSSLPPHSFISRSNKQLLFDINLIKKYLSSNIIPVLYGDMILDDRQNCSVLSGDVIVASLAKKLKVEKVIFLSDVDGIFDSDPKKNPKAKLIPSINNTNLPRVLAGLTENNPHDVTGEMKGKILEIQKTLPKVEVAIINGLKPNNLTLLLDGGQVGTRLQL